MNEETTVCEHQCSGNCRRRGCNCACGEFHEYSERMNNLHDIKEKARQIINEHAISQHATPDETIETVVSTVALAVLDMVEGKLPYWYEDTEHGYQEVKGANQFRAEFTSRLSALRVEITEKSA